MHAQATDHYQKCFPLTHMCPPSVCHLRSEPRVVSRDYKRKPSRRRRRQRAKCKPRDMDPPRPVSRDKAGRFRVPRQATKPQIEPNVLPQCGVKLRFTYFRPIHTTGRLRHGCPCFPPSPPLAWRRRACICMPLLTYGPHRARAENVGAKQKRKQKKTPDLTKSGKGQACQRKYESETKKPRPARIDDGEVWGNQREANSRCALSLKSTTRSATSNRNLPCGRQRGRVVIWGGGVIDPRPQPNNVHVRTAIGTKRRRSALLHPALPINGTCMVPMLWRRRASVHHGSSDGP